MKLALPVDQREISAFCRRWKVSEFALFGSILTDDFRGDSDVDCLVTFTADAHWTLFDMVHMQDELQGIFRRQVHLVSRRGLESSRNYLRRQAILSSAEVLHVA